MEFTATQPEVTDWSETQVPAVSIQWFSVKTGMHTNH